jgi:hypothetical protein
VRVRNGDEVIAELDLRAIEGLSNNLRSSSRLSFSKSQAVRKIQPESTPDLRLANYITVPRDSQERFLKQFPSYSGTA